MYCIHDSFIALLLLFLLIAGDILPSASPLLCLQAIFFAIKPLGVKKRNSNSANKVVPQQGNTEL
jgi:hypothetical protein